MKAAIFDKPGLENLRIKQDIEEPKITDHDVLVKVKMTGVNPIDHFTISGAREIRPIPHIPGAEIAGVVEKIGKHVTSVTQGDRVVVYARVFDGTCDMCLNGYEMLCRSGGIIGVMTNGGFAEYIAVPEKNVFKIPNDIEWELASKFACNYHNTISCIKRSGTLEVNESLLVFGASGNTGVMAIQFANKMGAKVIAVSKDDWINDFGADYTINEYDKVVEKVKKITNGKMADIVLNSLGIGTWESSFDSVGANGRLVTFGGLTGADVKLNVQSLYSRQVKLIGSTGGTRSDFNQITDMSKELKIRVWKKFKLDEAKEALQALFAKERDGRIMLEI